MKHVKLFEQFINEAAVKYPDSFKDEKAMEDFARIHGSIRYGYGNGGSAMGINDFDHKDENYREPRYGFKEMLRHYARNFDFVRNEPKRYVKEYEKLVDDWMDSELKSIPKFMKKYLTVGTRFGSSQPAYLIKPELQDDLVYVPLQNASEDLKQQYVAHRMKFAGEDVSKKLGL